MRFSYCCGDPQCGSSRQGSMQGLGTEGGWNGMPCRGWLMRWAEVLRQNRAIGALSHCRQPPAPSQGQLCHTGIHRPCWCRGWHCRSHRRAASPRQEHADLLSVSPRQTPTRLLPAPLGALAPSARQDQPLEEQRDHTGAPTGAWCVLSVPPLHPPNRAVQYPVISPRPVTPVHLGFLLLGGSGATMRGCVNTWGGREQGELYTWGAGAVGGPTVL